MTHRIPLLAALGLFSLPFLQPLHIKPIAGFHSEWLALALGLAMCLGLLDRKAQPWSVPIIAVVPLGFVALLGLQLILGMPLYADQALLAILYFAWTIALMLTTRALLARYGLATLVAALAWATLTGGLLGSLAGVLQTWNIHTPLDAVVASLEPGGSAYGNLGQSNHYTNHLALAFGSLLYLIASGRIALLPAALAGLWLLLGLSLSASRSSWLYLLSLAVLAGWFYRQQRIETARHALYAAMLALPAFLLLQQLVTALTGITSASARLVSATEGMFYLRLDVWRHAWNIFLEHPWLGAGWDGFAWHNLLATAADPMTMYPKAMVMAQDAFNHAHNLPLNLMAELGLGALLLVLGLAYWAIRRLRQPLNAELLWVWSLLTIISIHSLLEFPLWYAYFLGPFVVLLALAESKTVTLTIRPAAARLAALGVVIAGALLLTVSLRGFDALERAYRITPGNLGGQTVRVLSGHLQQAQAAFFFTPQVEQYLASAMPEIHDPRKQALQLQVNSRAVRKIPTYPLLYRQAILLALSGDDEQASYHLQLAARAYPYVMANFAASLTELAQEAPEVRDLAREAAELATHKERYRP